MPIEKLNINAKFHLFDDHWNPKIIGQLNGQDVKIAKVQGEFVWHNHKDEDELFYVIKGRLQIEFRDKVVSLDAGEMLIVPRGVDHKPVADEEVWLMLFEPSSTKHTGEVKSEMTKEHFERI